MADSCSFILGNTLHIDRVCFAAFRTPERKNDKKIIIIEKKKYNILGKTKCLEYLYDLIDMGFKISKINDDLQKEEIHVDISEETNKGRIISLCMAVRYLWEGEYRLTHSDKFVEIAKHYFKLKTRYKSNTKLENLCIANNLYLIDRKLPDNYNHMWCRADGCKILKKIDNHESTNDFFTYNKREAKSELLKIFKKENTNLYQKIKAAKKLKHV